MQEIAHATFTFEHFPEVMTMLWKRMLQDNKSNWRRTYKVTCALILSVEYLEKWCCLMLNDFSHCCC